MQVDYRRSDLSIDQQLALKTAAANLGREFDGTFGTETIDRFLHSSYDEFAGRGHIFLGHRYFGHRLLAPSSSVAEDSSDAVRPASSHLSEI